LVDFWSCPKQVEQIADIFFGCANVTVVQKLLYQATSLWLEKRNRVAAISGKEQAKVVKNTELAETIQP
jgi:hypothetical protein